MAVSASGPSSLRIADIKAYPTSFPVDPKNSVTLGIGRAVKRDAVIVKVTTDSGIVGWAEAHHGRAPGAVAHLVNEAVHSWGVVVSSLGVRLSTGREETN